MVQAIMGNAAGSAGQQPYLVDGQVVTVQARPYRVVQDNSEGLVLFAPENTPVPRWHIAEQRYLPDIANTRGESLRFLFSKHHFDVTLMFEGNGEPPWFYDALFDGEGLGEGWRERRRLSGATAAAARTQRRRRFRGWYVNMQPPFRRTPFGVDIVDRTLDIVVRPDRSWYWKDEDELAHAVEKGACSPELASRIRQAGEEAVRLIEARASPFDEEWTGWRAPEGWAITEVPDGWQTLPVLLPEHAFGG
jgi:predicted RNA-binding protein associated with RNAse of E/G family